MVYLVFSFLISFFGQASTPPPYTPIQGYHPNAAMYKGKFVNTCVWKLKTTVRRAARAANVVLGKKSSSFQAKVGDKFLHCAVSCKLRKKCGPYITYVVGYIKEILDLFNPSHDSELADLTANSKGIKFGKKSKNGKKKKSCYKACNLYAKSLMPKSLN